jgi:hypothetical protein
MAGEGRLEGGVCLRLNYATCEIITIQITFI